MTLVPATPDSGIVFRRRDASQADGRIEARWDRVVDTTLGTTIGNDAGASVRTVEHLMAALAGCGVDNAIVELDGPEVPIMDGSAAPFVFLIECAGLVAQDAPRRWIKILKPVEIREGKSAARIVPSDGCSVGFDIEFDSAAVTRQSGFVDLANGTFKSEIARARTFGFVEDLEKLRSLGLARGGSLDNAVVVSGSKVLNEDGLRFDDEFVRHKILDAIGDLYLAGAPIAGHFHGQRSGHRLTSLLLHRLMSDERAWCYSEHGPVEAPRRDDWTARPAAVAASA